MNEKKRAYQTTFMGGKFLLKKQKIEEYVICPVCDIQINSTLIHLHIDGCLQKTAESEKLKEDSVSSSAPFENRLETAEAESTSSDEPPGGVRLVEMKEVPGLWLIYNFISEAEEAEIVHNLDEDVTPWHFSSFNGNCNSKSFGVKTQFGTPGEERCVRRNNPALGEFDIPSYLEKYPIRLQQIIQQALRTKQVSQKTNKEDFTMCLNYQQHKLPPPEVVKFVPNECNANSYESSSKHYLRAHFDDRVLSGPILMNLSLNCDSRMTYHLATSNNSNTKSGLSEQEWSIDLPRRTLQLVTGPARWKYRHSIKAEDVLGTRRVSVTWRKSESKTAGIRHQSTGGSLSETR